MSAIKPFIETFTGRTFKPLNPDWRKIVIPDVAHALSNQCRFSGHVRFFYSVAEHCVRVSEWIERSGRAFGTNGALWGLLHDGSEAYLVDLPTPLKADPRIGNAYKKAERLNMRAVRRAFGLQNVEPEIVRKADAVMLATEVRDLMRGNRPYWKKLTEKPDVERIRPWSPAVAEYEFLRRFENLGGASRNATYVTVRRFGDVW